MKNNWNLVKFNDVVEFPPKVQLQKGEEYDLIEMEDIDIEKRYVYATKTKKYDSSGVSKFEDGDIVFARITPCLENGKIAQVKLQEKRKGFGSTELFVFRPKSDFIDSDFLYYLSKSDIIRLSAINSMTGASGRQRADKNFVQNIEFKLPEIKLQKRIGEILTNYDELIQNNSKRIDRLEKMAQGIYKEWFVRMRFPGYEKVKFDKGIPDGWTVQLLPNLCTKITDGTHDSPKPTNDGYYLITGTHINENNFIDFTNAYLISRDEHEKIQKRSKLDKGDIIFSNIGTIGRTAIIGDNSEFSVKNVIILKPKEEYLTGFLYYFLTNKYTIEQFIMDASGTSQQFISLTYMRKYKLLVPNEELLIQFDKAIRPILKERELLNNKILNLLKTRDLLLPRLMSGKLSVE